MKVTRKSDVHDIELQFLAFKQRADISALAILAVEHMPALIALAYQAVSQPAAANLERAHAE